MTVEATFRGKVTVDSVPGRTKRVDAATAMEAVFDSLTNALMDCADLGDVSTSGSITSGDFEVTVTIDVAPP